MPLVSHRAREGPDPSLGTSRRAFLRAGAGVIVGFAVAAHTPYRQWDVYRMKHLLIGTSREDAPSYPLGKQVASLLAEVAPETSARVTRARGLDRLGSLLSTGQLQVLLLSQTHLVALAEGTGPFAAFGPTAVARLFRFGALSLISRADFPAPHAWVVTRALMESAGELGGTPPDSTAGPAPIHPGALAALERRAIPEAGEDDDGEDH
jgi:hypothetical protein